MSIGIKSVFGITNVIVRSVSFKIFVHGFGAVAYVELFINIVDVLAYRAMTNVKPLCNFFIKQTICKKLQYFVFPGRENFFFCNYFLGTV